MLLSVIIAVLASIPIVNTLGNIRRLRQPPLPREPPSVAILIPARDEEANIGACLDAALESNAADVEVIVLDDGSRDSTAQIVASRVAMDARVRLHTAPLLPMGWRGKQHACHILSTLTDRPVLLFVDSDVRLASEAAARLAPTGGIDLVSGVPRQIFGSWVELAVVPMINTLIYGYLPVGLMRRRPDVSLAAACGQLIAVRAASYRACGGHAAIRSSAHDGLTLPRLFRSCGYRTDLVDATNLSTCRMYTSASALFEGFTKNATEGMARPLALPIWTILLWGGQLFPLALFTWFACSGQFENAPEIIVACAAAALIVARTSQAIKVKEPIAAIILHPIGILLAILIQWIALIRSLTGYRMTWRGRVFEAGR